MRIVHLVSYFPPDRIGGVGEVVGHLHRGLTRRGHHSTVVTSGTSHDDPSVLRICRSPGRFALAKGEVVDLLHSADVIHAQHGEAARLLRTVGPASPPVLLTLHVDNRRIGRSHRSVRVAGRTHRGGRNALEQRLVRSPSKWWLDRAAMRRAAMVSFICRSGAAEVLGPQGRDAPVVFNGVAPMDPTVVPASERAALLYVGTPGMRKRTMLLPAILEAVRRRSPHATLRIVGFDLAGQPSLEREFRARGLTDAVDCVGPIPADRIGPYYLAADVLVVPSAYEGLPMVIGEAAMHGLPCVSTAAGGSAEAIDDGRTGFVVPVDDVHQLAAQCAAIVSDPDRAASMGAAARDLATTTFSIDRQIDDYLDLYRRTAARTPAGVSR